MLPKRVGVRIQFCRLTLTRMCNRHVKFGLKIPKRSGTNSPKTVVVLDFFESHCTYVVITLSRSHTKHACKMMAVNDRRLRNTTVDEQLTSPHTDSVCEGQPLRKIL